MVGESREAGASPHFAEYVQELREFFRSRKLPFGAPGDVVHLAERMRASPAFAEEMGSMVRSILYREDEGLGPAELLDVVTVAAAGTDAEGATPEVQAAVRRIFEFLGDAVHQMQHVPEGLSEGADEELTAGDILATPSAEPEPFSGPGYRAPSPDFEWNAPVRAGMHPDDLYLRALERAEAAAIVREGRGQVLPPAAERKHTDEERDGEGERSMAQGWLIPAVAVGLAVIGVGAYVARPAFSHHGAQPAATTASSSTELAAGASCVAPMQGGATRDSVEERSRWAHNLLDQKLYDAALPSLREIARIDPGYPGIQLDQSQTLMNLKRPEEARDAVDNQISISECLARLPAPQLDAYCTAQFTTTGQGCRTQLTHIRQAAQLQAALIHLELGHRVDPDSVPMPLAPEAVAAPAPAAPAAVAPAVPARALTAARMHHAAPLAAAREGDEAAPVLPKRNAIAPRAEAPRHTTGEESLRKGEGTDSAFGAYQKPE